MKRPIVQAFKELKANGKDPNFLFIGDSVLHVASFNSFVCYMKERGVQLSGVICNGIPKNREKQYNETNIFGLDKTDYVYLENGSDVDLREFPQETILDSFQLLFRLLKQKSVSSVHPSDLDMLTVNASNKFFVLIPGTDRPREHVWNEAFLSGKQIVRVVLEEGVGTYLENPDDWFKTTIAKTRSKFARLLKYVRWYVMLPLRKLLDGLLKKKTQCVWFCAFNYNEEGELVPNAVVARMLESVFRETALQQNVKQRDFGGKVIIATTVLFEEASSQELETDVYGKAISICKEHGLDVVIKPHPRDIHLDKYRALGAEVIDDLNLSMESMLVRSSGKPLAILGLLSTAQVLASSLWGVPAIFLAELGKEGFIEHSDNLRVKLFWEFCKQGEPLFAQFAFAPKDFDELDNFLAEMTENSKTTEETQPF